MFYVLGLFLVVLALSVPGMAWAQNNYGTYSNFTVHQAQNDSGMPANCNIFYWGPVKGQAFSIRPNWNTGETVLSLFDKSWELPNNLDGSVIVESGSYEERLRISYNQREMVEAEVRQLDRFVNAFVRNYRMTIKTPKSTWDINLKDSSDAWAAFQGCVKDLMNAHDMEEGKNPWSTRGGAKDKNPWD